MFVVRDDAKEMIGDVGDDREIRLEKGSASAASWWGGGRLGSRLFHNLFSSGP